MRLADPCWSARSPAGIQIRLGAWWGGVMLLETLRYFGAFSPSSNAIIRTYGTPSLPFQGVLGNFNRTGRIVVCTIPNWSIVYSFNKSSRNSLRS